MNDPNNLRNFLKLFGIPFRPYSDVQEELA